ncbi:hypothetical protein KDJ56_00200 [Brevibacillus composti]|uniref:DUF7916 domain-containing protein n=1 Tax=Brevibacillus composti TaxID=2796470 RepID=A0A7T5EKW6_9BACL|nr:hypothetical protein JD108_00200 [Brevibacillus composti]QUO41576.1 hypothetical protein KDJ56_00200 [Brevibacillus composti]
MKSTNCNRFSSPYVDDHSKQDREEKADDAERRENDRKTFIGLYGIRLCEDDRAGSEAGGGLVAAEAVGSFIEAGADIILLPSPGTIPGITVESASAMISQVHARGALALLATGTSQEGADEATIRQIALNSKMAGADLHHIGDAGYSGIAVPENIMHYSIAHSRQAPHIRTDGFIRDALGRGESTMPKSGPSRGVPGENRFFHEGGGTASRPFFSEQRRERSALFPPPASQSAPADEEIHRKPLHFWGPSYLVRKLWFSSRCLVVSGWLRKHSPLSTPRDIMASCFIATSYGVILSK